MRSGPGWAILPPAPHALPPSLGRCVDGRALGSQGPGPSALLVHLLNPFSRRWSGVP